jgi:hypothetical protein
MKSLASVLKKFDKEFAGIRPGDRPNKAYFGRVFETIKTSIQPLSMEVYATARGSAVEYYVRGMAKDVSFRTRTYSDPMFVGMNVAHCIVANIIVHHSMSLGESSLRLIAEAILPDVIILLDAAQENVQKLDKAKAKAEENRIKIAEIHKRQATEQLERVFASYSYSRDEVLAIWNTDQVKRVMES